MKSYIGCICLTWLHCVFSNVSSKYLDQRRYNQIVCIGFAFLHCAFSCASSGFLFDTMHTCTGYLSFAHCSFPKASSKYLDQIMQNHNVCICTNVPYFVSKDLPSNFMHGRMHTHTAWICLMVLCHVFSNVLSNYPFCWGKLTLNTSVCIHIRVIFSYASSSTLHPCERVSGW